ncbi:MAG: signal recognition particle-docking protein FtsY [Clostridia bacterium]|jgi:fused signal recognition particle receptor|nr:signal recognition particle-docking protein FtsY [Clostridia bacterium]
MFNIFKKDKEENRELEVVNINDTIEETEEEESEEIIEVKDNIFAKLVKGLTKTKENVFGEINNVFSMFSKVDEELFEELEEALISADIGVNVTMELIEELRDESKGKSIEDVEQLRQMLIEKLKAMINIQKERVSFDKKKVLLVIGVNGVGKTTTIGKLAHNLRKDKKRVMLAAADTFRAAAVEQLKVWGDRSDVPVISQGEGVDPSAVIYDAIKSAKSKDVDVLICDTAGRLHNKKNLMEELKKISKVIDNEYPEAEKEVFLVLDATTGQNAISQVKLFSEVTDITGIVLTKLDGTAKGGVVIGISSEFNIPIEYIGVGEGINDLEKFDSNEFARALFN